MDHSLLDHLNQQSTSLGFGALFNECRVPEVGNEKEVFFSDYCTDQMERNKQEGVVAATKVCLCDDCKDKYESPQTTSVARRRSIARAVDRSAAAAQPLPQQHMQQQAADHSALLQYQAIAPSVPPTNPTVNAMLQRPVDFKLRINLPWLRIHMPFSRINPHHITGLFAIPDAFRITLANTQDLQGTLSGPSLVQWSADHLTIYGVQSRKVTSIGRIKLLDAVPK